MTLGRRAVAEALGTGLLLATIVGSGIMAERLAGGNDAIALLANALATGAGLVAILLALGPVSGAHLNPAVTLVFALRGEIRRRDALAYVGAQAVGALLGVLVAHLMFDVALVEASTHVRSRWSEALSEVVATFGLVLVVLRTARRTDAAPFAIAAYIVAAYWFTASTSFANPVVTLARSLTPTFAGIRPSDAPLFVVAQLGGAVLAHGFVRWIERGEATTP